jgi:hypothetical protein
MPGPSKASAIVHIVIIYAKVAAPHFERSFLRFAYLYAAGNVFLFSLGRVEAGPFAHLVILSQKHLYSQQA